MFAGAGREKMKQIKAVAPSKVGKQKSSIKARFRREKKKYMSDPRADRVSFRTSEEWKFAKT